MHSYILPSIYNPHTYIHTHMLLLIQNAYLQTDDLFLSSFKYIYTYTTLSTFWNRVKRTLTYLLI